MKTHRTGRAEQQQRRGEDFQQAKAMEVQRRLLIEFILDQKENSPWRHRGTEKGKSFLPRMNADTRGLRPAVHLGNSTF